MLLAAGARPSIFSAAMLGHLDTVKAFVLASPGVQKTRGPHGLTLLSHARAGGAGAADVVKYLESLGDADVKYTNEPLADADRRGDRRDLHVRTWDCGSSDSDRRRSRPIDSA